MPSEDSSTAGLIVWLVGLLFVIGIAGLIYHDARKNKVPCFGNTFTEEKDPKIWAVICFFFCPGWFYYLFRRTNTLNLATMKTAVETQNAQRSPTETKTEPTIETQLQTLIDLKNKGLITESEFEQKRKQILGL